MLTQYQRLLPLQDIQFETPQQVSPEEAGLLVTDYALFAECEPLFQAYEQLLARERSELERCAQERRELEDQNRAITRELEVMKDRLYQKTQELGRLMDDVKENGGAVQNIPGDSGVASKISDLFKKQQDQLLEELDLLKASNIRLERVALEREEKFDELRRVAETASDEARGLRRDKDILIAEVDALKSAQSKEQQDATSLQNERLRLIGELNTIRKKLEFSEEQRKQFESALSEMGSKKATTMDLLAKENAGLALKEKELSHKLHLQQREMEEYKVDLTRSKRDLDAARADCDQMVKIIEDNQGRIAGFEQREKSVSQLRKEAKSKIQQAETDREVAEQKQQNLERKLAKLQEAHRQELTEREQAYRKMQEAVRVKQKSQLDSKQEELTGIHAQFEQLKSEQARLIRDQEALRLENERYEKAFQDDGSKMDVTVKEHARKLAETQALHSREVSGLKETLTKLREQEHAMLLKKNEQEVALSELRVQTEKAEKQASVLTDERIVLKSQVAEAREMREAMREELGKLKELHQLKLQELSEDYNMRLASAQNESTNSREKAKIVQERALSLLHEQERLNEMWKQENNHTVGYFMALLKKLSAKNKALEQKLQG